MKNQLLLLIDIQNDYFLGGNMELYNMEAAADKASQLLALFRRKNWPIIHVQHFSVKPTASFFIPGSNGVEIHSSVLPEKDETVVQKNFPNSFRQTNLDEIIKSKKINSLVICGAMSHMCIDTTTRAACDLGYQITLIHDACATRNLIFNEEVVEAPKVQAAYMAALNGSFARVISASEFLMEMGHQ